MTPLWQNLGSFYTRTFCNFTGPLLTNCHILFMWFWFAKVIVNTNIDHSGYHLPFIHSSGMEAGKYRVLGGSRHCEFPTEHHDFHHLKFNVNYGTTGILDSWYEWYS